tara:strand:+ start:10889 stop:12211 length:1323 start_codon:yes stop_codon:yes gene_type:complete
MSSNQHLEIVPSNITADGKLSFRNGQPVVQFIIGEQARYLIGSSVRLCGKFTCNSGSTTTPTSTSATGLRMNEQLGVYGALSELHIKSQRTAQSIETIRHYNRMMSSYLGVTSSLQDGISHLNETALIDMNWACQQRGVVENPTSETTSNSFCIPLVCGLLNGTEPIPLAESWGVGGLDISLHLSPDSNVFFASSNASLSNITNSFYELSEVRLVCEVMTPAPDQLSRLMSSTQEVFEYNSIVSQFNTINSRNGILNFALGVSRCLGVFINIVPASHINNYLFDGLATLPPTNSDGTRAEITQAVFTRGGERFPLEYNIDTLQRDDATNDTMDAQIVRNYMNAVMGFSRIFRTNVSPDNNKYDDYGTEYEYAKTIIQGGSKFGLGVNYDQISGEGVSFMDVPFGLQLTSDLSTDSPQGIYLFAHCKNTVVSTPQGIQVLN